MMDNGADDEAKVSWEKLLFEWLGPRRLVRLIGGILLFFWPRRPPSNVTVEQKVAIKAPEALRRRRAIGRSIAAAALIVLSLVVSFQMDSPKPDDTIASATPDGTISVGVNDDGPRTQVLEDGSVVVLQKGTTLRAAFTAEWRDVHFLVGQATFNVADEIAHVGDEIAARPFRLRTQLVDATVAAAGTRFTVLLDTSVSLWVHHGELLVTRPGAKGWVIRVKEGESYRMPVGELGAVAFQAEQ